MKEEIEERSKEITQKNTQKNTQSISRVKILQGAIEKNQYVVAILEKFKTG